MPITRDQATHLAHLIATLRDDSSTDTITTHALQPLARHPAPLHRLTHALLAGATNPDLRHPRQLATNGPHWAPAAPVEPPPDPDDDPPHDPVTGEILDHPVTDKPDRTTP